jgi:hypothetical protein
MESMQETQAKSSDSTASMEFYVKKVTPVLFPDIQLPLCHTCCRTHLLSLWPA